MLTRVFATKQGMTQAWTTTGKRLPVTKCRLEQLHVLTQINQTPATESSSLNFEIGLKNKKLKTMSKPLRSKAEQAGLQSGVQRIVGLEVTPAEGTEVKAGDTLNPFEVLEVGEVVKVQGTTKGRGFAGAVKRHNFKGGPRTHGQSDRERAVGSIGAGTTPGRVWKGKRMPGHYGVDTQTVDGLVIVHLDQENNEVWLSGPVPGHRDAIVTIIKTGKTKDLGLDKAASGIPEAPAPAETENTEAESTQEAQTE